MLSHWIAQGENDRQDFKYKVMDAAKLAKSVSAFANTRGGRLLIGVRDDGHITGVTSEEEIFMMRMAAEKYCQPAVEPLFQNINVAGKTVVVCEIPQALEKPVCAMDDIIIDHQTAQIKPKGRPTAYIRINDENIVASPVFLQLWKDQIREEGTLVHFSQDEKAVIEVISTEGDTLNGIVRKAAISRKKVIRIIANLIRFNLVSWNYTDKQFLFYVKP
jgi:predicted HTH transcriptional regulator